MKLCLRILSLLWLLSATLAQDGFDLADALDDLAPAPTPAKPKEQPKPPAPKGDDNFDLSDAFGPDPTPAKPKEPPKDHDKPSDGGFNLDDALKPGSDPFADKPVVNPPNSGGGGGGGTFDDSDLLGVGEGGYKPDGGGHGAGGRAVDPGYDPHGGADTPQAAGGGQIGGIVGAVGVALLGAASSYFAYQKKKLCFKIQGGADPESGKGQRGGQSDPQLFSNLLRTS